MKKVLAAFQLVVHYLASLHVVTLASAVAGVAAPIVARLLGASITPAEVTGWLVLVGAFCTALDNILSGRAAAHAAAQTPKTRTSTRRSGARAKKT